MSALALKAQDLDIDELTRAGRIALRLGGLSFDDGATWRCKCPLCGATQSLLVKDIAPDRHHWLAVIRCNGATGAPCHAGEVIQHLYDNGIIPFGVAARAARYAHVEFVAAESAPAGQPPRTERRDNRKPDREAAHRAAMRLFDPRGGRS